MSVIQADEIKSKDFSMALPEIASELNFLVNGLRNTAFGDNHLEPEAIHGLAHILEDIGGDIQRINDVMYPVKNQDA